MAVTAKGTPYVVSTDLVANYPTVSNDLATHIDAKLQYNAQTINAQTGSGANAYTFALDDATLYKLVTATNAAAATYTVPPQSAVTWVDGAVLRILNQGAGVVTLAGGSGVTLNGASLTLSQYQYAEIVRTASNTWTVTGIATPPGLVKITDATFSAQSSVSVNNCFTSDFANYKIVLSALGTVDADVTWKLRASGTDASTAYYWGAVGIDHTGTSVVTNGNNSSSIEICEIDTTNASVGFGIVFDVIAPQVAETTRVAWNGVFSTSANSRICSNSGGGILFNSTSYDGFSVIASAGTMSGTVRVYGYRN